MRCVSCPCPRFLPCPGVDATHRAPHARYCELAKTKPIPWLVLILETAEAAAAKGRSQRPISQAGWRERRIVRMVVSCPFRGPQLTTGCDCKRTCYAGVNGGIVRTEDCRACVAPLQIEGPKREAK